MDLVLNQGSLAFKLDMLPNVLRGLAVRTRHEASTEKKYSSKY